MCKWGTDTKVKLCEIDLNGLTREQHKERTKILGLKEDEELIDSCIAPLVQVLNDYGIETVASCCGHGKVKVSNIRIHPKNIKLSVMKNTFTAWLEFPYRGVMREEEKDEESKLLEKWAMDLANSIQENPECIEIEELMIAHFKLWGKRLRG